MENGCVSASQMAETESVYERLFATKGEALGYERRIMQEAEESSLYSVNDSNAVLLSDLINRWYDMHGKTLSDGEARKGKLDAICERLGDPLASDFDKNLFCPISRTSVKRQMECEGQRITKTINRQP
ncbi:phage integrase [Morganella morganii]|uniref:phage integrase n=1 Tax=Morganella morganii TaxID=582 RepID=UPI003BF7C338